MNRFHQITPAQMAEFIAHPETLPAPTCWCGEDATVVVRAVTPGEKTVGVHEGFCAEHGEQERRIWDEFAYDVTVTPIEVAS